MDICSNKTDKIKLLDFQFGSPSMYKAVIGVTKINDGSEFWVPGESTSMISELIDLFGRITVYDHKAMLDTHRNHVSTEFNHGRINLLDRSGVILYPDHSKNNDSAHQKDAVDYNSKAVNAIVTSLIKK
jgi:hypothetical protein